MTAYPGTVYRYFSIDADHDISGDTLLIGTDPASLTVTAAYVASPNSRLTSAGPAPSTGMVRYWWSHLCGLGQDVALVIGRNRIYGTLADSPELEPAVWQFYLTNPYA